MASFGDWTVLLNDFKYKFLDFTCNSNLSSFFGFTISLLFLIELNRPLACLFSFYNILNVVRIEFYPDKQRSRLILITSKT